MGLRRFARLVWGFALAFLAWASPAAAERSRIAVIAPEILSALRQPAAATDGVALSLFDDLSVNIAARAPVRDALGAWISRSPVTGGGEAALAFGPMGLTAHIALPGREVEIAPLGDGRHRISEITDRAEADDTIRAPPDLEPVRRPQSQEIRQGGAPVLRILLAYTPKALADLPDIHAAGALIVSQINATLANSQVPLTVRLVGMDLAAYSETAADTSVTLLNAATNGTGDFARIAALRQAVNADVVMVLAHWVYDGNCGRGWQNDAVDRSGVSLADAARFGFSVVDTDPGNCIAARSATHELGHNLGAAHDRYVVPDAVAGPAGYNYGYVDLIGRVRDIMAYTNDCAAHAVRCTRLALYSNPDIIHNGRPLGVPVDDPKAANASRRIREIAPFVTQFGDHLRPSPAPVLAVLTSGAGAVSGGGIACGSVCSSNVTTGASVTLSAQPAPGWSFAGWSGPCGGFGACALTVNASQTVVAAFTPSVRIASVLSSINPGAVRSSLRVANMGAADGAVAITIADPVSGVTLGRWTSPAIPAGAMREYPMAPIERAIVPGSPQPAAYTLTIEPGLSGQVQHVMTGSGPPLNASTCDSGVTANPTVLPGVSASLDGATVSTIVIAQTVRGNANIDAGNHALAPVALSINDAGTGARLGGYVTPPIPRNGQVVLPVATIEAAAGIKPSAGVPFYVIAAESPFSGYLQHLVTRDGVTSDLTTACAFDAAPAAFDTNAVVQAGPVFAPASGTQSYLRFFNAGAAPGTVNVTLADPAGGNILGQWTSPLIAPGAARQVALGEIENAVTPERHVAYTAIVQTQMAGTMQHVLWRPGGALTNASTCDAGVTANPRILADVHASLLAGYPSMIVVTNTGAAPAAAQLGLYDAATGARLGGMATETIPPGGQRGYSAVTLEAAIGLRPTALHYVIKLENGFAGFLQHLVMNSEAGLTTDLSAICALPAPSIRYEPCNPDKPCALTADGAAVAGQLKAQYTLDYYRVTLAQGHGYTIEVKGRDSGSGTLFAPLLEVHDAALVTLANAAGGGTGRDVKYIFTPQAGGTFILAVNARENGFNEEGDFRVQTPTTGTYRISVRP